MTDEIVFTPEPVVVETPEPVVVETPTPTVTTSDLNERVVAFNGELKALCDKYELKIGAEARIFNGLIVAVPNVADARAKANLDPLNAAAVV